MRNSRAEVNNDEEALVVLSALGFSMRDWPCINKLGGPFKLLCSEMMDEIYAQKPKVAEALCNIRRQLDDFYHTAGFLISPLSNSSCRLFRFGQAPLVFFGRLNRDIMKKRPVVAVVGTRKPSSYGLKFTKELSQILANKGIVVVSGGAVGIDHMAHSSCIAAGGETIIIPGTPCNVHENSMMNHRDHGGRVVAVHPFGPSYAPGKYMFVERNRYVAGMADAVIIVQGTERSGTLYTARFASELKIPLWVAPGAFDDPLAFVPHCLLKSGQASLLLDFDQFTSTLVTKTDKPLKKRTIMPTEGEDKVLNKTELPYLLQVIRAHENSLGIEELMHLTNRSFVDLQRELLDFELSGRILKCGSQFVLTGN
jgi:DNA processing protein